MTSFEYLWPNFYTDYYLVFATNSVIVNAASLQLLDSVTDSKYGTVTT